MNAIEAFIINFKIAKFLKKNNLSKEDIKKIKYITNSSNNGAIITLKNNKIKKIYVHDYKLTRNGKIAVATVAAVTITGTLGSFIFKGNKENLNIELEPVDTLAVETTIDSSEVAPYVADYNDASVSYNASDADTTIASESYEYNRASMETVDDSLNHSFLRNISIYGHEDPGIGSYDYIINNYSDTINKYGNRYGIDPAIIAALIMQECGNSKQDNDHQESYYKLGLGQVNCDIFEGQSFNAYNFETGEYEKYTCYYNNLKNNRDEQIKLVAIMLQYYAILYDGNIACMLISYNQGMGTTGNIIKNVINNTEYDSKDAVLSADDITIIRDYNTYRYGDPDYFDKVITFLNYELVNETFGRNTAVIALPNQENTVSYSTSVELENLKGAR